MLLLILKAFDRNGICAMVFCAIISQVHSKPFTISLSRQRYLYTDLLIIGRRKNGGEKNG